MNFELVSWDYQLFHFFNSFAGKSKVLDAVFIAFAEYTVFVMLAGLAAFVFFRKMQRSHAIAALQGLAALFIGRVLFVSIIRLFFYRPRPFVAEQVMQLMFKNPLEGSFPSGHATIMFSLAFSLLLTRHFALGIIYFAFAFLSSVSRVVTGVHFPFDIAGGVAVAFVASFAAKLLFDFWLGGKKVTPPPQSQL